MELYLFSPHMPSWRGLGQFIFVFRILLLIDFDPPRPLPPLIPRNIKLVHRGFTVVLEERIFNF